MLKTSHGSYVSHSEDETKSIAKQIAKSCKAPSVLLIYGDLGAGKTMFVRGFAEGLGIQKTVASPSYTYLRTYPFGRGKTLYHFDLYLLSEKKGDTSSLFFDEALRDSNGIIIVEWADYLPKEKLPATRITISVAPDSSRKISVTDTGRGK